MFRREVRKKSELERTWRKQLTDMAYRKLVSEWLEANVMVVDESGDWLARWDQQFTGLGIQHLRSTTSIHPDPSSSYALEIFAEKFRRIHELQEMKHIDSSFDFRGPFQLPGTQLFRDFCAACIRRYALEGIVQKARVVSLVPVRNAAGMYSHSVAQLSDGRTVAARRVLVAIGSTNMPRLPDFAQLLRDSTRDEEPAARGMGAAGTESSSSLHCLSGHPCSSSGAACCTEPASASSNTSAASCVDFPRQERCRPTAGPSTCMPHSAPASTADSCLHKCKASGSTTSAQSECTAAHSSSSSSSSSSTSTSSTRGVLPPGRLLHAWEVAALFACLRQPAAGSSSSSRRGSKGNMPAAAAWLPSGLELCTLPECPLLDGQAVVVVGGGLTAAQLALLALRHGARQVHIVMRSHAKVKQFDVDVQWMGRNRSYELKRFGLIKEPAHRLQVLRGAIQGGSITPEAMQALRPHLQAGSVQLLEQEEVAAADCDPCSSSWELHLAHSGEALVCNHLWTATGSMVDASREPLFSGLLQQWPVQLYGGLPGLTGELRWAEGVDVHLLGAFAALQLGPGALNLAGARTAATRLVHMWRKQAEAGEEQGRWLLPLMGRSAGAVCTCR